jgi:uncharacterized protein YcsI (UPF0317 family)
VALLTGSLDKAQVADMPPSVVRGHIRSGAYKGDSWGVAPGYAQTALVAVPRALALEFLTFAQRNPGPCPILEITDPGAPLVQRMAPGADLRTDLSRYRVFERGQMVAQPHDVREYWRDDMVGFLIGCTGSFESYLTGAGIRLRHLEEGKVGAIFLTNVPCTPAGPLRGPLAVSMRPIHWSQVRSVVQLTSRFPAFHGAPVHVGDPRVIGIPDLAQPWFGDILDVRGDEVPVFWACSVTPQVVALEAKLDFMITNAPACMFVSDVPTVQMALLA